MNMWCIGLWQVLKSRTARASTFFSQRLSIGTNIEGNAEASILKVQPTNAEKFKCFKKALASIIVNLLYWSEHLRSYATKCDPDSLLYSTRREFNKLG